MKQFRFLLISIFCVTLRAAEPIFDPNNIPSEEEIETAFKDHPKVLVFLGTQTQLLNMQNQELDSKNQELSEQRARLQQLNELLKKDANSVFKKEADLLRQRLAKKTNEHQNLILCLPIVAIGGAFVGDSLKADLKKGRESYLIQAASNQAIARIATLLQAHTGLDQYSIQRSKFGFTIEVKSTNLLLGLINTIKEYSLDVVTATPNTPSDYLCKFSADQIKHMLHLTESKHALKLPNGYIILRDGQGVYAVMTGIAELIKNYSKEYPKLSTFGNHSLRVLEGEFLYNVTAQSLHKLAGQTNSNKEFVESFLPSNCEPKEANQLLIKSLFHLLSPEDKLKIAIQSTLMANKLDKNKLTIPGTNFGNAQLANASIETAANLVQKYVATATRPTLQTIKEDIPRELGKNVAQEVGYHGAAKGIHFLAKQLGVDQEIVETVVPKNGLPSTTPQLIAAMGIKLGLGIAATAATNAFVYDVQFNL